MPKLSVAIKLLATAIIPVNGAAAQSAHREETEVVVTGERTSRTVDQTAASVAVFDDEAIRRIGGANRVQDVLALIPNVQLGAGESAPAIRGNSGTGVLTSADAFLGGTRPRITLSVDGRPLSFNEFVYGNTALWDVARVEIFRGPQTTSQGRNAIAGAIFIQTADPTAAPEAALRFQGGDYGLLQGSAMVSGPILGEELTGRVAVDYRTGDDWVRRTATAADLGFDPDRFGQLNLRAKLKAAPKALPWLTAGLTWNHVDHYGPQSSAVQGSLDDLAYRTLNGASWNVRSDTGILDVGTDFGGGWRLETRLTYADITVRRFAIARTGDARIGLTERSAEMILRYGDPDAPISGHTGVYLFDARQNERIDLSAFLGVGQFRDVQDSQGYFAEVTARPAPALTITGGLRYQRDHQNRQGSLGPFVVNYVRSFDAWLPSASIAWAASDRVTVGALAKRGFNPGGTTISFLTGEQNPFEAETLWNYELFVRGHSADRRFGYRANLFYTDYYNAQRPVLTVIGTDIATAFRNAERARALGAELELDWQPTKTLTLTGALGLLDTKILRFSAAREPIVGRGFARAPGITASTSAKWQILPAVTIDAQARYGAGYDSRDGSNAAGGTPTLPVSDRFVLDNQISWQLRQFRLYVFARNLTDSRYWLELYTPGFGTPGEPRRVGAGIEARF